MRIKITLLAMLFALTVAAQSTMCIWKKNGTQTEILVSEISSITFSLTGSEPTDNNDFNMEQARQEIEQYLRDWSAAMIDADTEALGHMMADDIILRHITGQTQTKQEWLDEVASGSMDYHEIENRDVSITFIDSETADVSFTSVITATIWGSRGTWTLHNTMRLARIEGRWVRVNSDYTNAVREVRNSPSSNSATRSFTLSGTVYTGGRGIMIQNNKKYVRK